MKPLSENKLRSLSDDELRQQSNELEQQIGEIKRVRLQIAHELDRRVDRYPESSQTDQVVTPARVESEAKVGGLRRFLGR